MFINDSIEYEMKYERVASEEGKSHEEFNLLNEAQRGKQL
jgi:hypothetical protein